MNAFAPRCESRYNFFCFPWVSSISCASSLPTQRVREGYYAYAVILFFITNLSARGATLSRDPKTISIIVRPISVQAATPTRAYHHNYLISIKKAESTQTHTHILHSRHGCQAEQAVSGHQLHPQKGRTRGRRQQWQVPSRGQRG